MKTKYLKAFEGYLNFIDEIKLNLQENNGFIMIKNRKLSKVKDLKNRAFLSMIKDEDQKTIELAQKQAVIGKRIVDEMELVENSGLFKGKKFHTTNDNIKLIIEEYENHLNNELKPLLDKL